MKRGFLFLFCSLLLVSCVVLVFGCGKASSPAPVTPTNVTFTGVAAASAGDLAKLGATALAIETQEQRAQKVNYLKSQGFAENEINVLNLVPLAAANSVAAVYTQNSDGTLTLVANGTISSTSGAYSINITNYSTANAYVIRVSKSSDSTLGKEMIMETPVDSKATSSNGTLSSQNTSPTTTLLMELIKTQVVEALGTNALDPDTIALIKSIVTSQITTLVSSEGLDITTVKATSSTDNNAMKTAATQSYSNSTIQKAIQSVLFKAGLSTGATSQAKARDIMKQIFTYVSGSPTGIPENIINAFADSYVAGETRTVTQLVAASNKSIIPANNAFTVANVTAAIQNKINATFTTASIGAKGSGYEVKSQDPLIQAVFPPSQWLGKTLDGNTVLTVPQVVILMEIGNSIATAAGAQFNPPKVAMELNLITGIQNKFMIMHSEIRIESWENWQDFHYDPLNPYARPNVSSILTSFVDAGNMVDSTADSSKITATLTYTTSTGGTATVNYAPQTGGFGPKSIKALSMPKNATGQAAMGPPPGFVMFAIQPWGSSAEAQKITNFKRGGTATIKILNNGVEIDTKTITIASVDLSSAGIDFKTPYPNIFNLNDSKTTIFLTGTKPVGSWSFGVGQPTIDFGTLKAAYAIEVRSVDPVTQMANFAAPAVYSSWNKQDFLPGNQNDQISWTVPETLSTGTYCIQGAVVGLDNGWPVVSGPWRSTNFRVAAAGTIITQVATISGTVTLPTSYKSGTTVKVGLFRMTPDTDFINGTLTPAVIVTPDGSGNYSMTIDYATLNTKGYGGYDTIAWEDEGTGMIEGAAGERPFFPSKHLSYFSGMLNAMDSNFNPLGPISQNLTGYNIDMTKGFQ